MEISELIRRAREEDERRRQLGVDAHRLTEIAKSRELAESIKRILDSQVYPIENLRARIADLGILPSVTDAREALLRSTIFDSVREANLSALKMIEGLTASAQFAPHNSVIEELKKNAGVRANNWTGFMESVAPQMTIDKFLGSHLSQITQTSVLAQSALAGMELSKIGSAFQITDEVKASFSSKFVDFSSSYRDLFRSFEIPETSLFQLPPSVSEFPSIEFFNGVDLLETTVEEENQDEYEEERIIVREGIRESTNDSVIIQLKQVNEDWITMLEGARQAFNSTNPDKTRHCITSLRELVREIMHYLSPDDEIKGWSNSPDDFANKRPTRKARLRYITRNINHGPFTKFVEKDIEAILAAIDIFQAGTHVANSKLTEAQIAALIARIEGAILFLFSIAKYEE